VSGRGAQRRGGSSRTVSVGEQIRRELSQLLVEGLKDPRIAFVTISTVKVAADMGLATVNYTVLGSDKQIRDTEIGIQQSAGWIRRELSHRLQLRHMPNLRFCLDHNLENSFHIQGLLSQLPDEDRKPVDPSDKDSEAGPE
jgi:ribosome-binding factor A